MENIIDEPEQEGGEETRLAPGTLKRLLICAIILTIINVFTSLYNPYQTALPPGFKIIIVTTTIVGNSLIGFILSLFFSFIHYKNLPYSKKYLPTALLIIAIIQLICIFFNLRHILNAL